VAIVRCCACGVPLSRSVQLLRDPSELDERDGQPHLPTGRFAISGGFFTGFDGWLMLNLADAVNTRHHPDPGRHNGCCGLDGCDGPNTLCANGHEVGTERSDCWLPHVLLLDPGKAKVDEVGA
jgi:hypothetical protein